MSSTNNDTVSNGVTVDQFGVQEIYKTKQGAISWYLNSNANNSDVTIHELAGKIAKKTDRNFAYFSAPVGEGGLKSGGSRPTFRIDIRASGERNGDQKYNYKNGAVEHGFLWNENDIGDSEFTFVGRRRGLHGDHYVDFNIRGGDHHDDSPDSSCFQVLYPTQIIKAGTTKSMFAKEFIHAVFDHFTSTCKVTTKGWPENTWMAFKCVTYVSNASKREVTNRLYYDPDPIDFTKNPPVFKNNFILLSEYIDKVGDTGNYDIPATWKGCTWSIRIDNADFIDFACVSLRSIEPVINTTGPPDGGGGGGGDGGGGGTGGDDGDGGGTTGDGGSGGGTVSTIPILAPPQSNLFYDKGGYLTKKPFVWFIFWGADWNTRTTPFSRQNVMDKMTTLFSTAYFDPLFQYRNLKRPVLLGSSTCTSYTVPVSNQYGIADVRNIIQAEIPKLPTGLNKLTGPTGLVSMTDVIFVVLPPSGLSVIPTDVLPDGASHTYDGFNVWAVINYQAGGIDDQTYNISYELIGAISDPHTGDPAIILNPDANETIDESFNELENQCDPATSTVAGVTVAPYWSNEDNSCIVQSTYPTFISCHTGATWDPVKQECVVNGTDNPGGGIDDGGGIPIPEPPPSGDPPDPVYVPANIANPKANEVLDKGGVIPTQLSVYLIFWGSGWNSGTPLSNKTAIMDDMTTLFKTYYFDHIYQYRRIKRPLLAGMVTNTTYAPIDNYTATNVTALINDCKTTGLIPNTVDATKTLFIVLNLDPNNPNGAVNIDKDHFKDTYIWGYVNYHSDIDFWDEDLTNLIVNTATDTDPLTGFVLKSNAKFPGHLEGVDELTEICSTTADVNGVKTRRYWSNQDNACIAKNTAPTWISCPTGSTWHPDIQECVKDVVSGGGGGGGDTGGDGGDGGSGGPIEGPPFGGSDLPDIVGGKRVTSSILSAPPTRYFADKGGPMDNPMRIIFIFWGSEWNSTTPLGVSKDMIMSHMVALFNSNYFDGLYQYRKVKRPILLGSVVNTTFAAVSNFKHADVVALINDCVAKQLVPQNELNQKNNIVHFVIAPSGKYFNAAPDATGKFAAAGHSWNEINTGTVAPYHIFGWAVKAPNNYVLIDQTEWITHALIGILTDPKPETGIILSNTGTASALTIPQYTMVFPTKPPTLAKPKDNQMKYYGGPHYAGPFEFYFVFCGPKWDSVSGYSSKRAAYTADLHTIFSGTYFDDAIQYGIKRPVIKAITTNTDHPFPNHWQVGDVLDVLLALIDDGEVPFHVTDPALQARVAYYLFPEPDKIIGLVEAGAWHTVASGSFLGYPLYYIFGTTRTEDATPYDILTGYSTHEFIEMITDDIPVNGWNARPDGKFAKLAKTVGLEIADVCSVNTDWADFLGGVYCSKWWSDQAGKCILPTSTTPPFVSCPSGYKWDVATQQCISTTGVDDGNTGDNDGTGGPTGGPNDPILSTKKTTDIFFHGGPVPNPLEIYVILAGNSFNTGGADAAETAKLTNDLPGMFTSTLFDYLIQYGFTRRPIYKGIQVVTSPTLSNGFTLDTFDSFIGNLINGGKIPGATADKQNIAYLVLTPPNVKSEDPAVFSYHYSGAVTGANRIGAWVHDFTEGHATTMLQISYELIGMVSEPVIGKGWGNTTDINVNDICSGQNAQIGAFKFQSYWSDEDGKCMSSSTASPPWIRCPAGMTWDPVTQKCLGSSTGGGGGTGGTGGTGGSGGSGPPSTGPPTGGPELVDACIGRTDGKGFISDEDDKVSVVAYWSDQDGKCITSQSTPKWVTCPAGSTWDEKIQECVLDNTPDDGSGDGEGGGEGSGGGGLDDPGGDGTGDNTDGPPLISVSRDWTFRLDVGINSDDSCTVGNPTEVRDPVAFYDVPADSDSKAFEDLGYDYGNGLTEIGVYVNTPNSILYGRVIKRIQVTSIKRIIDENDDTSSGFIGIAIVQFPEFKIVTFIGDSVNVEGLDLNYQTLTFDSPDNTYPLGANDAILLVYSDDSASPDRCVRIKRANKNVVDGLDSFMIIRNANGYFVDSDMDMAWTIYE
jgi:hypothetical protein